MAIFGHRWLRCLKDVILKHKKRREIIVQLILIKNPSFSHQFIVTNVKLSKARSRARSAVIFLKFFKSVR